MLGGLLVALAGALVHYLREAGVTRGGWGDWIATCFWGRGKQL